MSGGFSQGFLPRARNCSESDWDCLMRQRLVWPHVDLETWVCRFTHMNQLNFYGLRTNNVNQVGVINVDNDNDSDKSRYTQTKPKGCKIIVERFTVPK